jgi:aspartate carbamoyltransferase regulatory subunit
VSERTEYRVTALGQGTVIDHLPPGTALKALEVLGFQGGGVVLVGMFLESKKWGKKDIIKIENKELSPTEFAKIALLGPHTTISIIRDYTIVEKMPVALPDTIQGVVRCPNPSCITNHDAVPTRFHVERPEPLRVRCHYCERVVDENELELV